MKRLLLIMTAALAIHAGPWLDTDGGRTSDGDPRIGQSVYVIPFTNWMVYANDNPAPTFGDFDHNDGWALISFLNNGSGTAQWIGSNSSWNNTFMILGQALNEANPLVAFEPSPIGLELDLTFVAQDGHAYQFGSPNIMTEQLGGDVPEPATFVLCGMALCGISWRKWKRRKY